MKTIKLEDKIIYQIFPRSFYDTNNDGDGDIKGIIQKLDYLQALGINAIWLCPVYDTNFDDAGYDVKDYKSIWFKFGTLDDFKKLTSEAAKRGIEIIMDIVLNHVSDQHKWFKKAIASENNREHNYFIWRKKLTVEESKAQSIFGGSAWEYVPSLKKYYFHLFARSQVDLNWEHIDTINAMADVIDFWYQIGVKGFRLDAIKHIHKSFPEGMINKYSWGKQLVPLLQKFIKKAFKGKKDAYLIGEASRIRLYEALKYGVGKDKVADNYYNFSWWHIGWGKKTGRNGYDPDYDFRNFVTAMKPFQESKRVTPSLMTNFLSNHDTSRALSRWGHETIFRNEAAKTLAMLLFCLKGVISIYYGEEIGMLNPTFENRAEFRDVDALNAYQILVDEKGTYTEEEMTKYHNVNGRDNCRTPMQWNDSVNAGFNNGQKTWIKVAHTYQQINVAAQENDPHSILNFYKKIIKLRKNPKYKAIFIKGSSKLQLIKNGVFKSTRIFNRNKIITFINMHNSNKTIKFPRGKIIARSWPDNKPLDGKLRVYESIMLFIKNEVKNER